MANKNPAVGGDFIKAEAGSALDKASKYIEPATITAILLGSIYYIGWKYNAAFFQEFGISIDWLDLTSDFYFRNTILPVLIAVSASYLLLKSSGGGGVKKRSLLQGNALLLIFSILCGLLAWQADAAMRFAYILICILMLLVMFVLIQNQVSIMKIAELYLLPRLLVMVLLFGLLAAGADLLGRNEGKLFTQGKSKNPVHVEFDWNAEIPEHLKGMKLVFLLRNRDQSYVLSEDDLMVDGQKKFPKIYVIDDSQIRLRIMQRETLG